MSSSRLPGHWDFRNTPKVNGSEIGGGSGVSPGADTEVLFNDGGVLGASAGLTYSKFSRRLVLSRVTISPTATPSPAGDGQPYRCLVQATFADGSVTDAFAALTADAPTTLDETHTVTVEWAAVPGATGYFVFADNRPGDLQSGLVYTGTALSFVDTGIAGDGVTYATPDTSSRYEGRALLTDLVVVDADIHLLRNTTFQSDPEKSLFLAGGNSSDNYQGPTVYLNATDSGGATGGAIDLTPGPDGIQLRTRANLHGPLVSDSDTLTLGLPGAPTASQTIQPAASIGTDQNGADFVIAAGAPSGTGAQGVLSLLGSVVNVTNHLTVGGATGDVYTDGSITASAGVILPTADPHVVGAAWNNAGAFAVSAG
jgi:hypothetical protein